MIVIKTCPPFPRAIAYRPMKGWGAAKAYKTSRLGVQNRNRMTMGNPSTAEVTAEEKIPLAAVKLAS